MSGKKIARKKVKTQKDSLEVFERVLDDQVTVAGDLKINIQISVAPLEKVEEMIPDWIFGKSKTSVCGETLQTVETAGLKLKKSARPRSNKRKTLSLKQGAAAMSPREQRGRLTAKKARAVSIATLEEEIKVLPT